MTYNLVFLKFNNYYNRRIKRYETISEYQDAYEWYSEAVTRNIDYNDGINISIVVNNTTSLNSMGYNYIIALESDSSEINSRWFILEEKQTRQGQWVMQLRRDLVSDFLGSFMSSTVYIEKGRVINNTLSIYNMNPLVFNQEQFSANQIKKKETLLKDNVGCKWIVGYLNKGYLNGAESKDINTVDTTSAIDLSFATENEFNNLVNKYKTASISYATSLEATFVYQQKVFGTYSGVLYKTTVGRDSLSYTQITSSRDTQVNGSNPASSMEGFSLITNNYYDMLNYANVKYPDHTTDVNEWLNILNLSNKIVLIEETGKIYRCFVNRYATYPWNNSTVDPTTDSTWYNNMKAFVNRFGGAPAAEDSTVFSMNITWSDSINIEVVELDSGAYTANIKSSYNRTVDEAFDAFAIPFIENKPIQLYIEGVLNVKDIFDSHAGLAVAQEIMDVSTEALDLQLLPYCPLPQQYIGPPAKHILTDSNADVLITIPSGENDRAISFIKKGDDVVNAIFWLSSTRFSNIIEYTDTNDYSSLDNIKAINQLDTWRISSGDYSSSFEFNMARNGGVSYFEIDCAYKPYQPYIHVAPNFGGLYGQDYNDTRGLICSNTNYSLPRLTDAWESYERNNLNYMNSFNRQIQKIDTDRKYQRIGEIGSIIGGTGTGAASGAMIGTMIAPGIGTAIGAAAGGVMSAGAGAVDMYINEQLYKENKKYSIDQFNMSLENIRALPNTLAAVGALNPNNKVFPILEHYSCSELEKEAFLNKLRWNGMSINVIGNPGDYIDTTRDCYFKGQIINIDIDGPAHEAGELAVEIAKGVIFERST